MFVHVHFGELLVHLFERIDMILFTYIKSLLRNPFGDTLERVNKDVHCSIIYSDKSRINKDVHCGIIYSDKSRINKDVHCSIIYSDKSSINLCWRNGLEDKELAV